MRSSELARLAGKIGVLGVLLLATPLAAGERRIVSLAPSITETLFAIGAGRHVVGVSDSCDWPPEARGIDRVGSYLRPNVEAILARRPDVVIVVPTPGNREPVEQLESLGIRVVVVNEGPTLADVYASIERIGVEAGFQDASERLVREIGERVAAIHRRVVGLPKKRVLVIVGRSPLIVAGKGTLISALLEIAGGENVAPDVGAWPRLSVEYVVQASPDVILDSAMGSEVSDDSSLFGRLGLKAAREGRVYPMRIDELLRPGPRLAVGAEKLVRLIHPEALSERAKDPP